MIKSFIEFRNVTFFYEKGNEIIKNVSFNINEGESWGLVGANGVGKSTLLRLLTGLETKFSGEISVLGTPVTRGTLTNIREKLGYVFCDSDNQLFMSSVYENVAFAPENYGISKDETEKRVQNALAAVGISHLKDRAVYKLSSGEKKLASIATILSLTPDIILMDEPTVTLDPRNRRRFIELLKGFLQVKLIATHDLDMVMEVCENVLLMYGGELVASGKTTDILTDRALLDRYGMEPPLSMGY